MYLNGLLTMMSPRSASVLLTISPKVGRSEGSAFQQSSIIWYLNKIISQSLFVDVLTLKYHLKETKITAIQQPRIVWYQSIFKFAEKCRTGYLHRSAL